MLKNPKAGGCGHRCCRIPDNPFHEHGAPAWSCRNCGRLASRHDAEDGPLSLAQLVASVVHSIVPQIPGLPASAELEELVAHHCLQVHASSTSDPALRDLSSHERRVVLAGRVGLALVFPVDLPPLRPTQIQQRQKGGTGTMLDFDVRELNALRWQTSSHSSAGDCVALAPDPDPDGGVLVRNSNDPSAGVLTFTRSEMAAFVAGCRDGEFDHFT